MNSERPSLHFPETSVEVWHLWADIASHLGIMCLFTASRLHFSVPSVQLLTLETTPFPWHQMTLTPKALSTPAFLWNLLNIYVSGCNSLWVKEPRNKSKKALARHIARLSIKATVKCPLVHFTPLFSRLTPTNHDLIVVPVLNCCDLLSQGCIVLRA